MLTSENWTDHLKNRDNRGKGLLKHISSFYLCHWSRQQLFFSVQRLVVSDTLTRARGCGERSPCGCVCLSWRDVRLQPAEGYFLKDSVFRRLSEIVTRVTVLSLWGWRAGVTCMFHRWCMWAGNQGGLVIQSAERLHCSYLIPLYF